MTRKGPKEGGRRNEPHAPKPAKTRSGAPCKECVRIGRKCRMHGGKSTGPKTVEGKRAARGNAMKHGLHADPLVFLDSMPSELRAAFERLVRVVAEKELVGENPTDLMIVRDIVLADLIQQRGLQYLLGEWSTAFSERGVPSLAQDSALSQWAGYSRLKAALRAALRQGTGERGDPGRQTVAEESRAHLRRLFGDREDTTP